jgi:hypothetical protein
MLPQLVAYVNAGISWARLPHDVQPITGTALQAPWAPLPAM